MKNVIKGALFHGVLLSLLVFGAVNGYPGLVDMVAGLYGVGVVIGLLFAVLLPVFLEKAWVSREAVAYGLQRGQVIARVAFSLVVSVVLAAHGFPVLAISRLILTVCSLFFTAGTLEVLRSRDAAAG